MIKIFNYFCVQSVNVLCSRAPTASCERARLQDQDAFLTLMYSCLITNISSLSNQSTSKPTIVNARTSSRNVMSCKISPIHWSRPSWSERRSQGPIKSRLVPLRLHQPLLLQPSFLLSVASLLLASHPCQLHLVYYCVFVYSTLCITVCILCICTRLTFCGWRTSCS